MLGGCDDVQMLISCDVGMLRCWGCGRSIVEVAYNKSGYESRCGYTGCHYGSVAR